MMTRNRRSAAGRTRVSGPLAAFGRAARAHPWLVGLLLACTALGALVGTFALDADWSLARRALGGAVAGAGCALLVTASRMFE